MSDHDLLFTESAEHVEADDVARENAMIATLRLLNSTSTHDDEEHTRESQDEHRDEDSGNDLSVTQVCCRPALD